MVRFHKSGFEFEGFLSGKGGYLPTETREKTIDLEVHRKQCNFNTKNNDPDPHQGANSTQTNLSN